MFESIRLIQNSSSPQLPLPKLLPISTRKTYPSFKDLAQITGSSIPAYIGLGPLRDPGLHTIPQKNQKLYKPRKTKYTPTSSLKVAPDYSGEDLSLLSLVN